MSGSHITRPDYVDIVRWLMQAPRTMGELLDMTELSREPIRDWLALLEQGGLVQVQQIPGSVRGGPPRHVYHWCPVPYERAPTLGGVRVPERAESRHDAERRDPTRRPPRAAGSRPAA